MPERDFIILALKIRITHVVLKETFAYWMKNQINSKGSK